jgi:hypothetical protein
VLSMPSIGFLTGILKDETELYEMRSLCLAFIRIFYPRDWESVQALTDVLRNTSTPLAGAIFGTLGIWGDSYSRDQLLSVLRDASVTQEMQQQCVLALTIIGDAKSQDVVITVLLDRSRHLYVRQQCADCLGNQEALRMQASGLLTEVESAALEGPRFIEGNSFDDRLSRNALSTILSEHSTPHELRTVCAVSLRKLE